MADEKKAALKKATGTSGGKDECQVRLKRMLDRCKNRHARRLWVPDPSDSR